MSSAGAQIDQWEAVVTTKSLWSALDVQSRLFDLWGETEDLPAGRTVERWLTLTLERELFGAAELSELLTELRAELGIQPAGV